jgi:hypothetical protein
MMPPEESRTDLRKMVCKAAVFQIEQYQHQDEVSFVAKAYLFKDLPLEPRLFD